MGSGARGARPPGYEASSFPIMGGLKSQGALAYDHMCQICCMSDLHPNWSIGHPDGLWAMKSSCGIGVCPESMKGVIPGIFLSLALHTSCRWYQQCGSQAVAILAPASLWLTPVPQLRLNGMELGVPFACNDPDKGHQVILAIAPAKISH
ncbi:hypothetical protein PCANC_00758 [Puccinia coronata f. sp. avenae]|uniref:Uncharacterized protein n=1 Tax=Puccinia coronata f. sp. avenae TaxID=200324 RepID=A0A2N5W720_9BASI|nr:hypothetical protein PCANC_00758 [Puccinia coronata f. sp. avenae]